MNKMGGITTMIQAAAAMESAGVWVMLFIMLGIMVVTTIVTGSGNAAFFAFSPLLPEAAASVGINTAVLVVPSSSPPHRRTMMPDRRRDHRRRRHCGPHALRNHQAHDSGHASRADRQRRRLRRLPLTTEYGLHPRRN